MGSMKYSNPNLFYEEIMIQGYKIITLCGSTKFKQQYMEEQKRLTLEGHIVISVGLFGHQGDEITEEQKIMLDDMHKRKIDLADEIFVINVNGYIGSSTKSEIEYAKTTNKTKKDESFFSNSSESNLLAKSTNQKSFFKYFFW